jgi:hypothetical protein
MSQLLSDKYTVTPWSSMTLIFLLNDYNLKRTKHTCSEPNLLKHLYHKREFKATNTPVWWHSSSDVDGHEWIILGLQHISRINYILHDLLFHIEMHTCICVQTHPNIRPIMDGIFAIFYFFAISEHFQILLFLKHGFKDKRPRVDTVLCVPQ